MNRFQEGQEWMNKRFSEHAQVNIIYYYGSGENDFIILENVSQGRTAFRIQDREQSRLHWNEADFFIDVNRLATNQLDVNTRFTPRRGHRIEITYPIPDTVRIFEVSAPDNEQDWRYSDPERTCYRIHTKAVTLV